MTLEFREDVMDRFEELGFVDFDIEDIDEDTLNVMYVFTNFGMDMENIREDDAWYYLQCCGLYF